MSLTRNQLMHRRAQLAEGRVRAALDAVECWLKIRPDNHFLTVVLRDIQKELTSETEKKLDD
jgi:hypothetical protein